MSHIDPSARVASSAILIGEVRIGREVRILDGAILDAGDGAIDVGAHSIVMEHAVLRASRRFPLSVADHCLVGPHTSVSGASIESEVFIATGAAVFPGAVVGRGSEIRIHGVVHLRTRLAAGSVVPIGWIAVGDPAQVLPPGDHDAIWAAQRPLDFPGFVFGVDRERDDAMIRLTERYGASLLRDRDAGE